MHVAPLTPAVFHILLALVEGDRYGYAIQQDVRRHSDGRVRMGPGTLYGTIQRLLELGWIEESRGSVHRTRDERRRYYRLTRQGRQALDGEVTRMDELVRTARARGAAPGQARS